MAIVDRSKIYEAATDFFDLNGSAIMELTVTAAVEVCEMAESRGLMIDMVEGGIRDHDRFEARLDCIWSSYDVPDQGVKSNNRQAVDFIRSHCEIHNAFILTTRSATPE